MKSWTRTCSGDLRPPFPPAVLEVSDQLLLLGIDGDDGRAFRDVLLHARVEILELGIAIGMIAALARLAVALQAVAEAAQQLGYDVGTHLVLQIAQRTR